MLTIITLNYMCKDIMHIIRGQEYGSWDRKFSKFYTFTLDSSRTHVLTLLKSEQKNKIIKKAKRIKFLAHFKT